MYTATGETRQSPVVRALQSGRMASTAVPTASPTPSSRHRRVRTRPRSTTKATGSAKSAALNGRVMAHQPTAKATRAIQARPPSFHQRSNAYQATSSIAPVVVSEKKLAPKYSDCPCSSSMPVPRAIAPLVSRRAMAKASAPRSTESAATTSAGVPNNSPSARSSECPGGYFDATTGSFRTCGCAKNSGIGGAGAVHRPLANSLAWSTYASSSWSSPRGCTCPHVHQTIAPKTRPKTTGAARDSRARCTTPSRDEIRPRSKRATSAARRTTTRNRISLGRRLRLFLVVDHVEVDVPEVRVVGASLDDVVHRHHGGEHTVVLVVVPVHAVPPHEEQVRNAERPVLHDVEPLVGAEVRRVRLRHAQHTAVEHVLALDEADALELLGAELDQVGVGHVPELLALVHEVLEADPHRIPAIGHHVRAPVVEHLDAADLYAAVLHVDPVVLHRRGWLGAFHLHVKLLEQQPDGEEVAVHESVGDLAHLGGRRRCGLLHELLHRHRREEVVAGDARALPSRYLLDFDLGDPVAFGGDADDGVPIADLPACLRDLARDDLPHLSRAELGVEEAGDEAGLALLLRLLEVARQEILHGVHDGLLEREALHALRAPVGADLVAPHPPHLLRVVAEEGLVEALAEPVDEERVEEGFVLLRRELRLHVAEADERGVEKSQPPRHGQRDPDGIREEVALVIDARQPRAVQQHLVVGLRIGGDAPFLAHLHAGRDRGPALAIGLAPRLLEQLGSEAAHHRLGDVIDVVAHLRGVRGGLSLARHHREPPVHHALVLREEPVPADVDAVALVVVGLRDAADRVRPLEDHGVDVGAREKLECGRETGRPRAGDHRDLSLCH